MSRYSIFLRLESIEILKAARGQQRSQITAFIDSLSSNPNENGDYTETDDADRDIEIKIVGKFAVTYWADHAVKEIKVVDIRRADRA